MTRYLTRPEIRNDLILDLTEHYLKSEITRQHKIQNLTRHDLNQPLILAMNLIYDR
jgi:hypothetical protein